MAKSAFSFLPLANTNDFVRKDSPNTYTAPQTFSEGASSVSYVTGVTDAMATTGNVVLDFDGRNYVAQPTLTGNVNYSGINYGPGKSITVRIRTEVDRTLTFDADWVFVGVEGGSPDFLGANRRAILTITCFEDTASSCIAAWAVEEV